jgi:hypothetical protein
MSSTKGLHIMSAVRLYCLDVDVAGVRAKVKELVDRKVFYDLREMLAVLRNLTFQLMLCET